MHYQDKEYPFSRESFERVVPLSPRAYREQHDQDLNEMRVAAGLPVVVSYDETDPLIQSIQSAAGIL